jgi:diguanylate cyclase (GGDEF)-like protein/PAS domain S-box-containing protein
MKNDSPPTHDYGLWDALPICAAVTTRSGVLRYANRHLRAVFCEADAIDAVGSNILLSHYIRYESASYLSEYLSKGTDFSLQLELQDKDGNTRWMECTGTSAGQRPMEMLCLLHDVSVGKRAELAARAQAAQLRLLADSVPAAIAYYAADDGYTCLFANKRYAETNGFDVSNIVGRKLVDVIGSAANSMIKPMVDKILQELVPVNYVRPAKLPSGEQRWLDVSLIPQISDDGKPVAAFVLIMDVTKHIQSERALRESEARLQTFMDASAEGIVVHQNGKIVDVNPALCAMVGRGYEELVGSDVLSYVGPEYRAEVLAQVATSRESHYESAIYHRNGELIPVEFIGRTMNYRGVESRMSIVRDLRDRKVAQERINYLAHHDEMTGLPNRARFMSLLQTSLSRADTDKAAALLFVDLDNFKRINDSLSHRAGDEVLREVARRLRAVMRETDIVARYAGDEFVVLMQHVSNRDQVAQMTDRLLNAITQPIDCLGNQLQLTTSVGIAMYPEDSRSPEELLSQADAAVYSAKAAGGASRQFYTTALSDAAQQAMVLEQQLHDAIRRRQFVIHLQPQQSCTSGELVGFEALIRWQHPERGLVVPNEFIPLAEERRLMNLIGEWVINEVAGTLCAWRTAGLKCVPIAVNLSSQQFEARDFLTNMSRVLGEARLPGDLLVFELTERMLMDDVAKVTAVLHGLRQLGIRVAVDDFGTGYSSLGHLKHYPIDTLKVDRSFVRDLPDAKDSAAITTAIVQMAHSLGIEVLAEGVETQAQYDYLRQLGCDEVQGFLIGKPMTAAEAMSLL